VTPLPFKIYLGAVDLEATIKEDAKWGKCKTNRNLGSLKLNIKGWKTLN
jgi:hypothetical protein